MNVRRSGPDPVQFAELRRAAEHDWTTLAADLRVAPVDLADIPLGLFGDPSALQQDDPIRTLATRFSAAIEQPTEITQRAADILRLIEVVDELQHATTVLYDEVSMRYHRPRKSRSNTTTARCWYQ
ncbi:hypothetical protein [Nocardia sp. NBC_00403]|uniref:hypothetical protein n=1 Tax=Nocardia sp. NBC_00403 TaxID=2975990 RepID=UPI002E22FDF9